MVNFLGVFTMLIGNSIRTCLYVKPIFTVISSDIFTGKVTIVCTHLDVLHTPNFVELLLFVLILMTVIILLMLCCKRLLIVVILMMC